MSSMRTVTAKSGRNANKRMGIVTLEDLHGKVEAVVFPDDLIKYRSLLAPDQIVFVEGTVDRKREEPSIRVSRVVPAKEAVTAFAKALILEVKAETPVRELADLMRAHRGECRVYLNVEAPGDMIAQIECHPSLRPACGPELLAGVEQLLGRDAVCVLGPARRPIPVGAGRELAAMA